MESGAQKLFESVTQKTLHAHAFSRASSQATLVLTDLLSRYFSLLTSTSAKYAQHAGRTKLTIYDVLQAIEELGTSLEDLNDFGSTEGKELNRYALHSARRAEELNEFKSQLLDGLRQDRDDATPLQYARYDESETEDIEEDEDVEMLDEEEGAVFKELRPSDDMDVDIPPGQVRSPSSQKRRLPTPPLPPSPISNSPSPSRKRARTSNWTPPDHIPDFLPPFPSTEVTPPPEEPIPSPRLSQPPELPSSHVVEVNHEKAPIPISQPLTATTAVTDILVQVPYSQSTIASLPERHLPGPAPPHRPARPVRYQAPQIEPSFIGGYHYILTHPPPTTLPASSVQRHRVATSLLNLIQTNSRWSPADTLYASTGPCPPRVATISPSYPIAVTDIGPDGKPKDGKEDKFKFPAANSRPVIAVDRLATLVSQPSSRIPDLARHVLHPTILNRTTRLQHPPVLYRGPKALIYGSGIPAPWNSNPLPSADVVPSTPMTAKPKDGSSTNGKEDVPKPAIPDARLYATWDYESKDYRIPLPRTRGRIGSIAAGSSGVITLPTITRKGAK